MNCTIGVWGILPTHVRKRGKYLKGRITKTQDGKPGATL